VNDEDAVTLIARRTVRAPVERVFEIWTRADELMRWWGPRGVECVGAEVELRVGGSYRLGNRFPDGRVVWIVGAFEAVEPPNKLIYSWRLEPGPERFERVTVRFEPRDAATEVIVIHERIASRAARDEHSAGWEAYLDGLVELLTSS